MTNLQLIDTPATLARVVARAGVLLGLGASLAAVILGLG
jgi:hypothetical protein